MSVKQQAPPCSRWRELPADEKAAYTAHFKEQEQVCCSFSMRTKSGAVLAWINQWPAGMRHKALVRRMALAILQLSRRVRSADLGAGLWGLGGSCMPGV